MRGGSTQGRQGLAVLCALLLAAVFASVALAAPGDLDPTFDGDGKRTINYGGNENGGAVAVQPDGKIVLVSAGLGGFAVTRLNPDGSSDASFGGGDGVAPVTFPNAAVPDAVALQPDGKILVIGRVDRGHSHRETSRSRGSIRTAHSMEASTETAGTSARRIPQRRGQSLALRPDGRIVLIMTPPPWPGRRRPKWS